MYLVGKAGKLIFLRNHLIPAFSDVVAPGSFDPACPAAAGFLSEIATRSFNHDHVGITAVQPPLRAPSSTLVVPKGFRVNARRQLLGTGSKARK